MQPQSLSPDPNLSGQPAAPQPSAAPSPGPTTPMYGPAPGLNPPTPTANPRNPVIAPQPSTQQPLPTPPQPTPASNPPTHSPPQQTPMTGIPLANIDKERQLALWLTGGSLAVFLLGILIGFAALIGAVLGGFGLNKSRLINYTPGIVMGAVGMILNVGLFLIAKILTL